jgi:pyroglutamyl-peptidase
MRAPSILLTGFEPFGGESVNPSWQVAQALDGERISGATVHAVQLPCVFGAARAALDAALLQVRPTLVLALGQAGGRDGFTVERVAINVDDGRIPDNAGQQPIDVAIVPGGPAAYFATLPIKAMVTALQRAGWPAAVSQTAGTYVCNHVFYGLMHSLRRRRRVRAGFMHLPWLPEQAAARAGQPSLPLDVQTAGVRLALQTALATTADLQASGGAES